MNKYSKNHNWMMLILLAFTCQTIALPFADFNDCESAHSTTVISDDTMSSHDMSMMDMSSNIGSSMTMDCCVDECQCSDGMCVSTVYFSIYENNALVFNQNKVIFQESQFSNNKRSSSIYRPPILS